MGTYEFTNLQHTDIINSFPLRNVMDMNRDFKAATKHNLDDIGKLCLMTKIQPGVLQDGEKLGERLEQESKNVIFEYTYLNEKTISRNSKMKNVIYPNLQRKQILAEILKGLWKTHSDLATKKRGYEVVEGASMLPNIAPRGDK